MEHAKHKQGQHAENFFREYQNCQNWAGIIHPSQSQKYGIRKTLISKKLNTLYEACEPISQSADAPQMQQKKLLQKLNIVELHRSYEQHISRETNT